MTKFLLALSLCAITLFLFFSEQTFSAYAVPVVYNQTAMVIPWTIQSRNSSVEDVFVESGYNGTITSWYHHTVGGTTLVKQLGSGTGPITLNFTPFAFSHDIIANGSNIYYVGVSGGDNVLQHVDVLTGIETHDFTINNTGVNTICSPGSSDDISIFVTQHYINVYCVGSSPSYKINIVSGNSSIYPTMLYLSISDMKMRFNNARGDTFISNSSSSIDSPLSINQCELTNIPTNKTNVIDNIGCDISIPNHSTHYWNGMKLSKVGNYYMNQTLPFFNSINANPYKKMLTLTGPELGFSEPFVTFILHSNVDYLVVLTSTKIYYVDVVSMNNLLNSNRAIQSYMTTTVLTDSNYNIPKASPQQSFKTYGPSTNVTLTKYGMFSLTSGYIAKMISVESGVRTLDPQWTNDFNHPIPVIGTGSDLLFPIVLTVSNAPIDASIKVTNPYVIMNGVEQTWAVSRLDSTHTAEFDILPNQCPNVYVADNSMYPLIYNFEGTVCATGTTQKTIAYTNTLPLSFWTNKYSATHTYLPTTNSLTVTTRSSVVPFTYNVIVKNSTGAIAKNFTATINGTIDTHTFNVTNSSKPSTLYVSVLGSQIYAADLGSPISYASIVSFFSTYFSYQGFNLLSMIPIIFASMFTRNTVGIGTIATVLCIATLSWLSVLVLDQLVITIMFFISVIGLIAYRVTLY